MSVLSQAKFLIHFGEVVTRTAWPRYFSALPHQLLSDSKAFDLPFHLSYFKRSDSSTYVLNGIEISISYLCETVRSLDMVFCPTNLFY